MAVARAIDHLLYFAKIPRATAEDEKNRARLVTELRSNEVKDKEQAIALINQLREA